MIVFGDNLLHRLGCVLAAVAVYLQLISFGLVQGVGANTPYASDELAEHALCLADQSNPTVPGQPIPGTPGAPTHSHFEFCCVSHHVPGIPTPAVLPGLPVDFAYVLRRESILPSRLPGPRYEPANARAPPKLV